ncbi:hypothetical protein TSUD_89610 [Trifolium subterraneum]|uniref:Uncharacterized protein n=1 Tax=Trifolium subterraneum TaxID=3900 RepID=A0A2Z6P163_TRISU|nr:hypothetical protein TSUD_89610 [Trifolium subterraneum]
MKTETRRKKKIDERGMEKWRRRADLRRRIGAGDGRKRIELTEEGGRSEGLST